MAVSPSLRVRFIQAAKEGNVEALKQFVEQGVSLNTVDSVSFVCNVAFVFC
jgi:hypothetical protein